MRVGRPQRRVQTSYTPLQPLSSRVLKPHVRHRAEHAQLEMSITMIVKNVNRWDMGG